MTTINLAQYVVRGEDGSLDMAATLTKFEGTLIQYQAERETEAATVGAAVLSLFEPNKALNINMPALVSMSLQRLNVQPENYKALSEKVATFVHDNASDKRESGKLFRIAKGKGGGVRLWESIPVEQPAA